MKLENLIKTFADMLRCDKEDHEVLTLEIEIKEEDWQVFYVSNLRVKSYEELNMLINVLNLLASDSRDDIQNFRIDRDITDSEEPDCIDYHITFNYFN